MRTTVRAGLLMLTLAVAMAGCGDSGDDELRLPTGTSVTSTTVSGAPATTTAAPVTTAAPAEGRTCADILDDAVKLANAYRMESRGVAGPGDPAPYRARAQALLAEARALGCPIPPGIEDFIP